MTVAVIGNPRCENRCTPGSFPAQWRSCAACASVCVCACCVKKVDGGCQVVTGIYGELPLDNM